LGHVNLILFGIGPYIKPKSCKHLSDNDHKQLQASGGDWGLPAQRIPPLAQLIE
jgi:hypothetical protein